MRRGLIVLLALAAAAGVFGTFALIETSMAVEAFRATTVGASSTPRTTTSSHAHYATTTIYVVLEDHADHHYDVLEDHPDHHYDVLEGDAVD